MFSNCILEVCESVITIIDLFGESIPVNDIITVTKSRQFSNILGELFVKFISDTFSDTKSLRDFCELILVLEYI